MGIATAILSPSYEGSSLNTFSISCRSESVRGGGPSLSSPCAELKADGLYFCMSDATGFVDILLFKTFAAMEAAIAEEVVGMRDATSPVFSSHTVEFEEHRTCGVSHSYHLLSNRCRSED